MADIEQRVKQLEDAVEVLKDALIAATKLSTTPPERNTQPNDPRLYGTARIAEILRSANLMPEGRSDEERWQRMDARKERSDRG